MSKTNGRRDSLPTPDILAVDPARRESATELLRRTEITRFRVFARVRPFIVEELAQMKDNVLRSVVEMMDTRTILLDPKENYQPVKEFDFDASFWSIPKTQKLTATFTDTFREQHDTQLVVYNAVAKGCVEDAFEGYNSCVLTYGQTGSGKTYTMMGKYNTQVIMAGANGEEGIIPRVCNDLFVLLEKKREAELSKPEAERITYRVEVNFVEIYMEKVRDLLDPALQRGREVMSEAKIRQDPESGPFIEGVTKYRVENWGHCCTLLERGSSHRTTCATVVHQQSSRSHAIFQITIVQQQVIPSKDRFRPSTTRLSAARINLVDLAGSERGGFTDYVKESAQINKSLLALRRVIDNLVERQNLMMEMARQEVQGLAVSNATLPQVPFRDSVLTWLLSDSIGGNARTAMVATLSPLEKNYNDTYATLTWSSKARNLVTVVAKNDTQSAFATKNIELQSNLLIRQQTVDGLRQTLQQQLAQAEQLERDAAAIRKRIKDQTVFSLDLAKEAYATRIARWLRTIWGQRKLNKIKAENDFLADRAKMIEEDGVREAALAKELGDQMEAKIKENEGLRTKIEDNRTTFQSIHEGEAEFKRNAAAIEAEYEKICAQIGADTKQYRTQIDDIRREVSNCNEEVEINKKKKSKLDKELSTIESEVEKRKQVDYSGKLLALKPEHDRLDARIAELRDRVAKLKERRDILKRENIKLKS